MRAELRLHAFLFYGLALLGTAHYDWSHFSDLSEFLFEPAAPYFGLLPAHFVLGMFDWLPWIWRGSVLLAALGFGGKSMRWIVATAAFFLFGLTSSFFQVHYTVTGLAVAVFIYALMPMDDPKRAELSLSMGKVYWVFVFTSAAIAKARWVGLSWAEPESVRLLAERALKFYTATDYFSIQRKLLEFLAGHERLGSALFNLAWFLEATAWIALFRTRLRVWILGTVLFFLIGVFFILGQRFMPWLCLWLFWIEPNRLKTIAAKIARNFRIRRT